MNIVQIQYFFELAEQGSFRKAAEKLYVSQPAVSKQISLLEKEWGFPLFERSYRSATLTPAGKIMYDAMQEHQRLYDAALLMARKESRRIKATLSIGIPEHAEMDNFVDIVQRFQQEHPELHVKLQYAGHSALIPEYPDGKFDIVVNYERSLINNRMLETRLLAKRRHVAIISKHHPLVLKGAHCLEDLAGERLYVPSPDDSDVTVDYAAFICSNHGFVPHDVVTLPNIDSVLLALKMSFGFAVLDDLVTLPHWFDLMTIPANLDFNVLLAYHRDNRKPCVAEFADYVSNQLVLAST